MKKFKTSKFSILFLVLFIFHIFFTFYNLEKWAPFDWDHVNNAWASLRILLHHEYPLIGFVAKGNSGMYIGPFYYYLVSFFYYMTHLDPIAQSILAGCTRIFSFIVIAMTVKRLFNEKVALMSSFIYTWSAYIIHIERSQAQVNFIAPLSLLILYYLFEISKDRPKYFIHLSVLVGLSFHIHFTAIFYLFIIFCAIPIIPFHTYTWKYIAKSFCVGILFFIPQIIYYIQQSNGLHAYSSYFQSYYHGFHVRRVLQLQHDAFIKFQSVLEVSYPFIKDFVIVLPPLFIFSYLRSKLSTESKKLSYLIALWFLIPWLIFSTYSGEISDYYFSINLYVVIIILAYLSIWIWDKKIIVLKLGLLTFWLYFAMLNSRAFFQTQYGSLIINRNLVKKEIENGKRIEFTEGDPKSYLYFYYIYTNTKQQPY